jgi:hypothetical protein
MLSGLSLRVSIVSKTSKASEFCGSESGAGSAPPPGSCIAEAELWLELPCAGVGLVTRVADPDPAFHSIANPDPAFHSIANPDPAFHLL